MAVKIGDTFRAAYADGNPLWKVTRRSGKSAVIAVSQSELITLSNGTQVEGDYAGIEQAFTVRQVEAHKNWMRTLNRLGDQQEKFFASLKVGQVVHYHDGFGNYVRCEIVVGTAENISKCDPDLIGQLLCQPIALVGAWRVYDLPSRDAQGNVKLGYHAQKIVNRTGAWQPSYTCVYESPGFSGPKGPNAGIDPRELDPIDLSVPDMTEAEAQAAAAEQLRAAMIEALNDYRVDGRTAIENAMLLVVK